MAGEIFIARQDTLEAVQTTVEAVKTTTTDTKADTDGIKLSAESIKAVADTILERIGLTTDAGGANTGTVFGKLNALFSSGGGISGFKYKKLAASRSTKTYVTTSFGIVIGDASWGSDSEGYIAIDEAHGGVVHFTRLTQTQTSSALATKKATFIGLFIAGATIKAYSYDYSANAYIFEFI